MEVGKEAKAEFSSKSAYGACVAGSRGMKIFAQLSMMLDDMTRYDNNVFLRMLTAPWM